MKRRRGNKDQRRREHIAEGGRAFLPAERMRAIRYEESVAHSRGRRGESVGARWNGVTFEEIRVVDRPYTLLHTDCHCGSIDCLGVPHVRPTDDE